MLGYAFMRLATLAAAPVFSGNTLASRIRWLFVAHGLLLVVLLIFPALSLPQQTTAAQPPVQIGTLANRFWGFFLIPIVLLLAI